MNKTNPAPQCRKPIQVNRHTFTGVYIGTAVSIAQGNIALYADKELPEAMVIAAGETSGKTIEIFVL